LGVVVVCFFVCLSIFVGQFAGVLL